MLSECTTRCSNATFRSTIVRVSASASARTSTTVLTSALPSLTRWRRSVTTETPAPAPVRDRSRYSLRNMVLSLVIVLGIVVLFVVLLPRPHYDAVKEINPTQAILSAQRVAPYHAVAPTGLSKKWRATSATVTGPDEKHVVHLHIGYVSPKGAYVGFEESNEDRIPFVELETAHGKFKGQVIINGQTWDKRFSSNQNDYAIDRTENGVTFVISGNSVSTDDPYAELTELAASLR